MVNGIVDIPLDGVFVTGDDTRITTGALGVPGALWAPGTPMDILMNEQGFEDVYNTFGGVEANMMMRINCDANWFFGYRYVTGRADYINVGTAVVNPETAPLFYPIFAQFSEFSESRIHTGFSSSRNLRGKLDLLWAGRIGIGFVDGINARFDIPDLSTSATYRIYDSSTILNFGLNFGFRRRIGCHLAAHVLTGLEYRSSLNEFDAQLANIGLEEFNNGSGFASLPVYMGLTYYR